MKKVIAIPLYLFFSLQIGAQTYDAATKTLYVNTIRDEDGSDIIVSRDNATNIVRLGSGDANDRINFYAGGTSTPKATLLSNGNVGIGTDTPDSKLHIQVNNGTVYSKIQTSASGTAGVHLRSGGSDWRLEGGSDLGRFRITRESTEYFSISNNGNVGIGINSPDNTLHIFGPSGEGTSSAGNILSLATSGTDRVQFGINSIGNAWIQPRLANLLLAPHGGNVGIGTTSPSASLHVKSNTTDIPGTLIIQGKQNATTGNAAELVLSTENTDANTTSGNQSGRKVLIRSTATSTWGQFPRLGFFTSNSISAYPSERMVISPSGSVGIGTVLPNSILHVKSNIADIPGTLIIQGKQNGNVGNSAEIVLSTESTDANTNSGSQSGRKAIIRATATTTWGQYSRIGFFTSNNVDEYPLERMVISPSGNVGIGTTNPDAKLTVKGTIHTEEVKVDLSVPGPDYVFEPDYDLRTLQETKEYIEEDKHLPEIPSAKEMEANGVDIGEMNMLLLKKIEELTLHQIGLLEKLELQQRLLEVQQNEINNLKKKQN